MSDHTEFLNQIKEIQQKIDLIHGTPQKNKTLLQYIEETCTKKLDTESLPKTIEKQITQILEETKQQLAQIKNVSNIKPIHAEYEGNVPKNLLPTKAALNSVKIGGFDPSSSPILRRLNKSKLKSTLEKSKASDLGIKKAQEPLKSDQKNDMGSKSKKEAKKDEISTPLGKKPPADLKGAPPTKKEKKSTDKSDKVSPKSKSETDAEILAPFPEPTPFPVADDIEEEGVQLMATYLQVDQLNLRIELPFETNMVRIGRQDLMTQAVDMNLPPNFFNPIIERSSDQEPSEHFVIEQPNPGEFILRDRFNSQKTYFLNHFVDQEGTALNDGDTIILPVNINNKMASLTIVFHLQ